jgi:predicted alpha/beta superfamily hydrolase
MHMTHIYLPPNYAADSVRYPVVYWLPGGGCAQFPGVIGVPLLINDHEPDLMA